MSVDLLTTPTLLIGLHRLSTKLKYSPRSPNVLTKLEFTSFINANRDILQNVNTDPKEIDLIDVRFCGFFTEPLSLFITGPQEIIYRIERAWFMRLLQPPDGFSIQRIGKC